MNVGFTTRLSLFSSLVLAINLFFALAAVGQVNVQTIGGGVRVECGSSSGFVAGNTWTNAQFNQPWACAMDTQGDMWIADLGNWQ